MTAQMENATLTDSDKATLMFITYKNSLRQKAYTILHDYDRSEDAVQHTFAILLRHMDKIGDPFGSDAKYYLFSILTNHCYDILKSNKKYYLMDDTELEMNYGLRFSHPDNAAEHIICEEILDEARKIPLIYSNLLILHAHYGYSLKEISEMLELKPATVRKRVERARKMLAKLRPKEK